MFLKIFQSYMTEMEPSFVALFHYKKHIRIPSISTQKISRLLSSEVSHLIFKRLNLFLKLTKNENISDTNCNLITF